MSSPLVAPRADLVFFQDESHYTWRRISLPDAVGVDAADTRAYLENGVSLLFSKEDKKDQVEPAGFINYIDNLFERKRPNLEVVNLSSTINFNLPEGIINVMGSSVVDIDSEGYQQKPMVHTIMGGAGKFLGKTGYAVIEPIKNKELQAFVWLVYFTN